MANGAVGPLAGIVTLWSRAHLLVREAVIHESTEAAMLLTAKQRLAYQLCRKQGLSQAEVGRRLSVSRESVNRLLARADDRIKSLMRDCSGGQDCGLLEAVLN